MPLSYETSLYTAFGARLRQARRQMGLTQEQLGKRVGLTRTSITNIERGEQRPPLHIIFQLAAAIAVEPRDLLPSTGELPPAPESLEGLAPDEVEWIREFVFDARAHEEDEE